MIKAVRPPLVGNEQVEVAVDGAIALERLATAAFDAVVLDVRETGDFSAGHIANARHLPEAQLNERIGELEKFKARPIIVACRTGNRALSVAGALRKRGFAEAVALRGGIAAWQQASMPLQKG